MDPALKTRRSPLVLATLTLIAILSFALVSRLVTRYRANERQLAWHVFEQGQARDKAGDPLQYQLNLARALRDSGKLDEAEAYLSALWQRTPEDGIVNLALARLAVRRNSIPGALRYYHNAIYGSWPNDLETNQRNARLELIHFLIQRKANSFAESELIGLVQTLPPDPTPRLEAASLYVQIQDYDQALTTYQSVLKLDPQNPAALAGAGNSAYQMGRYRTAQQYLTPAVEADPKDEASRRMLETASLVLKTDPFLSRISDAERNRRLVAAFNRAGERLQSCAASTGIDLQAPTSPPAPLQALQSSWSSLRSQLHSLRSAGETDLPDTLMDLVAQIETQTAQQCGPPSGLDFALLLVARNRNTVDQ